MTIAMLLIGYAGALFIAYCFLAINPRDDDNAT